MRFLNPKTDFAFKKIFGSEESHDILISFLNAILSLRPPHQITEVQILDPYLAPKIKGWKETFLDVRVRDQSQRRYIIEMQVLNFAGFEKKILYNACKAYVGQLQRGDKYHLLTNIVAVTITDFIMFEELCGTISRFMFRSSDNPTIFLNDMELVFAELPKFSKNEEHLDTIIDKWLFFFKHAGDLRTVPKTLMGEPAIMRAFKIADKAGLTPDELDDQEKREFFIQHQRGAILLAEERGIQIGEERGIQIGEERGILIGEHNGKMRTLLRQIQRRFGQPPEWVHTQLAEASLEKLDEWAETILDASSLEEMFK